ncbi:MAG: LamG domain-containing protein [Verrucomicrobiota bacterium]
MENKMGCLAGLVLFSSIGLANAKTIAYWRFEEGAKGAEHVGDQDGFYQDSSGNGNHLSSWTGQTRPMATDDLPFAKVPQTGKKNTLALDFDGVAEEGDDLVTTAKRGGSDKMIDSFPFKKGWTIEATFKIHSLDRWQVFVGKDKSPGLGGEPVFSMKVMKDNRLQILFCDDDGVPHWIESTTPLSAGEWYSAAATYDGEEIILFLKRPDDKKYSLQGYAFPLDKVTWEKWTSCWTIGRGMWNKAPTDWFHGVVDEVRISDVALKPKEFLAVSR